LLKTGGATPPYQVYPRSFYDTNRDGIADIKGITEKFDYIQSLRFETIWCSPFFISPQQDFGYDISDYREISIDYGNMDDGEELILEVHKRKMRIVFDMVMNQTGSKFPWSVQICNLNVTIIWICNPTSG
jgi:glycosidase